MIILRSNIFKLIPQKEIYLHIFNRYLVESRLNKSEKIKVSRLISYSEIKNFSKSNKLVNIVAPVCPDYSYEETADGKYRYTFEKINNGISIVAQKAISNANYICTLLNDLVDLRTEVYLLSGISKQINLI